MSSVNIKKKKKYRPMKPDELLNIATSSWADEVESERLNKSNLSKPIENISLPSAPRSACDVVIDESKIAINGPFKANLSNLPFDVVESEITDIFKNLKISNITLLHDERNRLRGQGIIEFYDKSSLILALREGNVKIKTRIVQVELPHDENDIKEKSFVSTFGNKNRVDSDTEQRQWRVPKDPVPPPVTNKPFTFQRTQNNENTTFRAQKNNSFPERENEYNDRQNSRLRVGFKSGSGVPPANSELNQSRISFRDNRPRNFSPEHYGGDDNNTFINQGSQFNDNTRKNSNFRNSFRGNRDYNNRNNSGFNNQRQQSYRNENNAYLNANSNNRYRDYNNGRSSALNQSKTHMNEDVSNNKQYGRNGALHNNNYLSSVKKSSNVTDSDRDILESKLQRPKIEIFPRSIPTNVDNTPISLPNSIFGGAKPVDTTKKVAEIEEKLAKTKMCPPQIPKVAKKETSYNRTETKISLDSCQRKVSVEEVEAFEQTTNIINSKVHEDVDVVPSDYENHTNIDILEKEKCDNIQETTKTEKPSVMVKTVETVPIPIFRQEKIVSAASNSVPVPIPVPEISNETEEVAPIEEKTNNTPIPDLTQPTVTDEPDLPSESQNIENQRNDLLKHTPLPDEAESSITDEPNSLSESHNNKNQHNDHTKRSHTPKWVSYTRESFRDDYGGGKYRKYDGGSREFYRSDRDSGRRYDQRYTPKTRNNYDNNNSQKQNYGGDGGGSSNYYKYRYPKDGYPDRPYMRNNSNRERNDSNRISSNQGKNVSRVFHSSKLAANSRSKDRGGSSNKEDHNRFKDYQHSSVEKLAANSHDDEPLSKVTETSEVLTTMVNESTTSTDITMVDKTPPTVAENLNVCDIVMKSQENSTSDSGNVDAREKSSVSVDDTSIANVSSTANDKPIINDVIATNVIDTSTANNDNDNSFRTKAPRKKKKNTAATANVDLTENSKKHVKDKTVVTKSSENKKNSMRNEVPKSVKKRGSKEETAKLNDSSARKNRFDLLRPEVD